MTLLENLFIIICLTIFDLAYILTLLSYFVDWRQEFIDSWHADS
jgi:hypothetical protein